MNFEQTKELVVLIISQAGLVLVQLLLTYLSYQHRNEVRREMKKLNGMSNKEDE